MQKNLADLSKESAEQVDQSGKFPKLILIGINQVGSSLIQMVPDIAKRTAVHRIKPGNSERIRDLIETGCKQLNVKINQHDQIFEESKGDYWLTQSLCQSLCAMNNILETADTETILYFDIDSLRKSVIDKIGSGYCHPVKEFCRGKRFRPTNDPYYKLLKAVGEQDSSIVDLNELANSRGDIRGSINNIKEKRLGILLDSKLNCAKHFYYNKETKYFAIEDPALFYYLKHLDWDKLRMDCGFRLDAKDYEFDFAISFAGENRELAKYIAEQIEILDGHIFFDEFYEDNYLGKTWSTQFESIFSTKSRLVICLLDSFYKEKIWPTFERECFLSRVANGEVIPIFLDATKFVGIPSDTIGIKYAWDVTNPKWHDEVVDKIVFRLMERLN
jgi:hypothetical protein